MAHPAHAFTRAAVRLDSVTKVYGRGGGAVTAIDNVSVSVPPGTFTAVMGPSGSGKSTFLHCAAGLDRPTTGSVSLGSAGTDLSTLPEAKLTKLRRDRIGFVFQAFNLLAALNVRENVTLPLRLAGRRAGQARLAETLARVGLSDRGGHLPSQLSGGEQQRVAIARALITQPEGGVRRRAHRRTGHRDRAGDSQAAPAYRGLHGPDHGDGHARSGGGLLRRLGDIPSRRPHRGDRLGPVRRPDRRPDDAPGAWA